jgi:hypothetical protein
MSTTTSPIPGAPRVSRPPHPDGGSPPGDTEARRDDPFGASLRSALRGHRPNGGAAPPDRSQRDRSPAEQERADRDAPRSDTPADRPGGHRATEATDSEPEATEPEPVAAEAGVEADASTPERVAGHPPNRDLDRWLDQPPAVTPTPPQGPRQAATAAASATTVDSVPSEPSPVTSATSPDADGPPLPATGSSTSPLTRTDASTRWGTAPATAAEGPPAPTTAEPDGNVTATPRTGPPEGGTAHGRTAERGPGAAHTETVPTPDPTAGATASPAATAETPEAPDAPIEARSDLGRSGAEAPAGEQPPLRTETAPSAPGRPIPSPGTGETERLVRLSELADAIRATLRRSGPSSVRVQLHPAELGTVEVEVRLRDDGLHLLLRAEQPHGAERLTSQLTELRRALERDDLHVRGLEVSVGTGDRDTERRGDTGRRDDDVAWRDRGTAVRPDAPKGALLRPHAAPRAEHRLTIEL